MSTFSFSDHATQKVNKITKNSLSIGPISCLRGGIVRKKMSKKFHNRFTESVHAEKNKNKNVVHIVKAKAQNPKKKKKKRRPRHSSRKRKRLPSISAPSRVNIICDGAGDGASTRAVVECRPVDVKAPGSLRAAAARGGACWTRAGRACEATSVALRHTRRRLVTWSPFDRLCVCVRERFANITYKSIGCFKKNAGFLAARRPRSTHLDRVTRDFFFAGLH